MSKKSDSFYNNLETKLNETHDWPTDYVFKFIVENKAEKINQVELEFKKIQNKNIKENFIKKYLCKFNNYCKIKFC